MNKYNIIGDIHGRDIWSQLVRPDMVNVFVGDYFDPYDNIPYETVMSNMVDIIQYKKDHPGTILLLGNHDLHYLHLDDTSRMDYQHRYKIKQFLLNNLYLFRMSYPIYNQILVTHAGVTKDWLELTHYDGEMDPNSVSEYIENLFLDNFKSAIVMNGEVMWEASNKHPGNLGYFMFSECAQGMDCYGTTPTQSPVWIRPQTLVRCNALENYTQIVGHTQVDRIEEIPYPVWLVDCLGQHPMSLVVNIYDDEIIYDINRPME